MDINKSQEEIMKTSLIFFIKTQNVFAGVYSEPCQTSKMETFTKIASENAF